MYMYIMYLIVGTCTRTLYLAFVHTHVGAPIGAEPPMHCRYSTSTGVPVGTSCSHQ